MKRSGVRRLFSLSLRRDRWAREVEEEILTHLTIRAERLQALGMSPQSARDEALRRFGPLDESRVMMIEAATHREEFMRRRETFAELRQDLTFASRTLSRNKGWAAVAVLTLALGIAATTAVWSAATTLLLHPLAYPDAGRVVNVNLLPTTGNSTGINVTINPESKLIRAWRRGSRLFQAMEPYAMSSIALGSGAEAEDAVVTRILPSFIGFAGAQPILGRAFTAAEVASKAPVAMLGEGFWRGHFGGASAVIGQTIILGGEPVRIVGVMPSSLRPPHIGGRPTNVWLPLDLMNDNQGYRVVGRLAPAATQEMAARELDSITVRSEVYASSPLPFRATITSPGESVSFRDSLLMLTGAVFLVLLVAAANVAHLLLARGLARRREVAIRTALGASRGRILRQVMTETFVLSAAGCALGTLLGYVALSALVKFRPPTLPELQMAHIDPMALGFVVMASMLCAVLFGAVGSAATPGRSAAAVLRAGAASGPSRFGERLRSSLVITEMALSAMLLVGAALLVRTVVQLQRSDLGFDPRNLHVIMPELPQAGATPESQLASVRSLADAIRGIPGVVDITVTDAMPSYRNFAVGTLEIEGRSQPDDRSTSFIDVGHVTSSYFRTLGARLVDGRMPDSTSVREILINEGFAQKVWKGASPVGRRLRVRYQGQEKPWMTIVGVVHDISATGPGGDRTAPFLYASLSESRGAGIVYRTDGREATVAQAVAVAKRLFPGARIRQHVTKTIIDDAVAPSRFIMLLMAGFTLLTLLLAAVGLYGMMSYAVAQRTREIGIRIALGATRDVIARAVVGRGALLGATGATAGLVLALWATRIIESSLYGIDRLDFTSFIIGGIGLVLIAIVACVVPTWRAVRVDPMTSIRAD
jgi:putative ABC transport system permease protein